MATTNCKETESTECRNDSDAFLLKMIAIAAILISGAAGIAIPLIGKEKKLLRTDSNLFFASKAFAAGVILATGFVHILPDATSALTNTCLPETPWLRFLFAGFIAMISALLTLVADFLERKRMILYELFLESESDGQIVAVLGGSSNSHGQSHAFGDEADVAEGIRHVVVSQTITCVYGLCVAQIPGRNYPQILEVGIVSHSVIIGLSLGVSHSLCTIRPLIAALSFHQFFEGFALGGCISQAQLEKLSRMLMAFFFAVTTPAGIGMGTGIASFYNSNSPRALVVEGVLDSISAGILVYMALVDLIATDFLSKRMRCNAKLQIICYFALFLGALSMSSLAIWA
ncbi:hypothetical protein MKW94_005516 [Papaver nudicaule]|uniref:Uncharacterized protein n=1 Tax=Papaver nudicaule TaxID=74823 RepID=A0AA41V6Y6_PAPNU|nr:hypothetical protein [Papaver nudicaule]